MAKLTHAESRRLYSWWWDSHISPKNSKWLQENLSDMDSKVKSMIKLIEEDADSFARRAEMYYKKRPELMKLVEEFYRAYRALAERYDHATGALRQAHRTMAEAFPNQVPSFSDDSPTAASTIESEPRTPGAPPIRSFFDSDGSNNIERNGAYDDNDSLTSKRSVNSKYRKGQDDEGLEEAFEKIKKLQEKISQLSSENDTLKTQVDLDSENKNKAENEIQRLKETQSKLQSEKEAISLNFQQCLERVVVLEAEIEKFTKLNAELLVKVDSLEGAEEICSLLEKEKQSLYLKVDGLEQKTSEQQEQLMHKQEQLERLKTCVQDEQLRAVQAEAALGALEELHAQSQEQLRISSLDIQNGVQILKEMESKKQALEEDIRHVREENENLSRELKQKQEELEKLNAAVENEHLRSVQAEAALHSLEKLHAQSQEELKLLMLDIQSKVHTLNDVESRKQHLEEELRKLKEQIRILNEQNISSQLMIRNLQNEILSLKEAQSKLENEMRHHADGKEVLKKELHDLKEEMDGLQLRHKGITDQLEAVGLNGISLQALVKELRDGNLELKEICKKQEDKNVLLLERLEHFEKVSEKNVILENSLSDANVELEGLREKIKVLQESYEDLGVKHSALIAEKTVLVYKVETITENMGKLLENNTFLENSLSDANVELEALREQLRSLEESCQVLHDDKSSLQREKNILYSQVDLIGRNLENLEKKYTELHDRHSNLDREKELTQNQLTKLHDISKLEKEEHEAFKLSTISRLTNLEDQISLLREESGCKEQQFETEQIKFLGALIEIFILQRCVADLNYGNLSLSNENHKLEQDMLAQKEKAAILLDHIGRLRNGMWKVLKDLDTNGGFELSNASEELCWQFILDKVRELQDFAFKTKDENLGLIFENSVNAILLQQLGLDIADLKSEKSSVEQDCRMKTEKLLLVQAEKCDLLRTKEQLKENMASGYKREAILKEEMEIIGRQLSELKDAQCVSQDENCQLLEERQLLLAKLFSLGKEQELLEDEHVAILQELVTLDCLYLQYEQLSAERTRDLKTLINELKCSHEINSDLGNKVDMISAKLRFVEAENLQLKDLTSKFEECKTHVTISAVEASMTENVNDELNCQIDQLNQQIETGNALLIEKEKELSEAHVKFQDLQNQDEDLRRNLEDTKREAEESKVIRDGLEEKLSLLSENVINSEKELALIHEENVVLVMELQKLKTENEELRVKKEKLTSLLQNEVECCEDEVAALCTDIQTTTVHAVVSEEKLMELMGVCEELEMKNLVERRALIEEVNLRDAYIEKLCGKVDGLEGENRRMKSELDEYLPVISSLQDSISSLESFIVPSSKTHTKDHHEVQDFSVKRIEHDQGGKEQYEEPRGGVPEGILELQNLLAKVDAIHEVLVHSGSHLVLNNINLDVKIDKQGQEIEETRLQKSSHELNNVVTTDTEVCSDKDVLIMKDIQLDHASSSSKYDLGADSYEISVGDSTDTNDPSLESWETAEKDGKNKVQRLPISTHSDIIYRKIEAEEEEKSEYPSSELVMEKELGVDKLEVPKKDEGSHQDWNKKVLETLTSDAQRLCVLQTRVQDLKNKMDDSEKSNYPKNSEYNSVKGWLQEAEEAIHLLFERNKKLTKKAEDFSAPPYNSKVEEPNDEIGQWRRQVSGRARRGSDRIGKWELELQKIQYILLKFEEELEYRRAKDSEKRRVLLRDYLYGRGDNRRKKRNFCCTRPAVKDD